LTAPCLAWLFSLWLSISAGRWSFTVQLAAAEPSVTCSLPLAELAENAPQPDTVRPSFLATSVLFKLSPLLSWSVNDFIFGVPPLTLKLSPGRPVFSPVKEPPVKPGQPPITNFVFGDAERPLKPV